MAKIKLIECPRDAMQGIKTFIPTDEKVKYIQSLLGCGFDTIDFGSFVSPKAIPQMQDTAEVLAKLDLSRTKSKLLAIVANVRGAEDACKHGAIDYLGFPFSISENFQMRNTHKTIAQSVETLKGILELAHAHDIAVVIEDHVQLAQQHGLDGVHLLKSGGRHIRQARAVLGPDAIVGAYCNASRHEGMTAAEAGADYVSFGPVRPTSLGSGEMAEPELFAWWSEMIEVPVVAEGGLDAAIMGKLAPITDFIAIGSEIWSADNPTKALSHLWRG